MGKTIIHRSTQGTQGVVNAKSATEVIFGSFVTASAIVGYIQAVMPDIVSIVPMGNEGTEDDVYADFLTARIQGKEFKSMEEIKSYLKKLPGAARFFDPSLPEFPREDFDLCLDLDRFNLVPIFRNGRITKQ